MTDGHAQLVSPAINLSPQGIFAPCKNCKSHRSYSIIGFRLRPALSNSVVCQKIFYVTQPSGSFLHVHGITMLERTIFNAIYIPSPALLSKSSDNSRRLTFMVKHSQKPRETASFSHHHFLRVQFPKARISS